MGDADNGDLVNVDGDKLSEPTEAELIVARWDNQRKKGYYMFKGDDSGVNNCVS